MDPLTNPSMKELPSQLKAMAFMQPKSMGHFKRPKQHRDEQKPKRTTEVLALAQEVLEREDSTDLPNWMERKPTLKDSKTLLKSRIQVEAAGGKNTVSSGKIKTLDLQIDVLGQKDVITKSSVAQTISQPQLKPLQKMFLDHKLPVLQTPSKQVKAQQALKSDRGENPQPSIYGFGARFDGTREPLNPVLVCLLYMLELVECLYKGQWSATLIPKL